MPLSRPRLPRATDIHHHRHVHEASPPSHFPSPPFLRAFLPSLFITLNQIYFQLLSLKPRIHPTSLFLLHFLSKPSANLNLLYFQNVYPSHLPSLPSWGKTSSSHFWRILGAPELTSSSLCESFATRVGSGGSAPLASLALGLAFSLCPASRPLPLAPLQPLWPLPRTRQALSRLGREPLGLIPSFSFSASPLKDHLIREASLSMAPTPFRCLLLLIRPSSLSILSFPLFVDWLSTDPPSPTLSPRI